MNEEEKQNINISVKRRKYLSDECSLTICPECDTPLIEENCTIILAVKSDIDEAEFITNLSGSHFCNKCPVVVFDFYKVQSAANVGIKGGNLVYFIKGIVDLNSIPKEKRHLELGIDGNPIPLVQFLPDLKTATIPTGKRIGRNDTCPCGSGLKYKKCCG